LIGLLLFSGWVLNTFSENSIPDKDLAPRQLFLLQFQSFGGKNEKVLPEDALAKALRDFFLP
jgi:hypothetical protein